MDRHKLVESFNCAIEGVVYVLKTQRNMRFHFAAAALVIIAAIVLDIARVDFLFLCSAIFLVLFAEMVNTAAELTIDLISETYHPLARIVKDIGAGAVLIASLNAIIVGYLVLCRYLEGRLPAGVETIKRVPLYVTFLVLLAILLVSVILKLVIHRGTPMMGGMPSVHSAMAFSAATIILLLLPSHPLVLMLVYFLALMVVQSRIAARIHTLSEVAVGALLGSVLTLFFYQVYKLLI